jgi:hypothetical protein
VTWLPVLVAVWLPAEVDVLVAVCDWSLSVVDEDDPEASVENEV